MYNLIKEVKRNSTHIANLCENIQVAPINPTLLFEAADKYIGAAIGALKAGKNPFETIPGSREVLAGLMLLAKETNRQALNLDPKKFDIISQKTSEKDSIKKYVANLAQKYGPSLIKNLDAYMADENRRGVLTKKLVQLQNEYSAVKQKLQQGAEHQANNQNFSDNLSVRAG